MTLICDGLLISDEVSNALLDSPSIGMRCVNNYSVLNYDDSMITCDNGMGMGVSLTTNAHNKPVF